MIALIVALPVLALASAVALYGTLRWAKHEIRRNASAGSTGSGDGSSSMQAPLSTDTDPPAAAMALGGAGYAVGPTEQQQEPLIGPSHRNSSRRLGFKFRELLSPRGVNDSCCVGADAAECGKAGTAGVGSNSSSGWLCWKVSDADQVGSLQQQQQQRQLSRGRTDTAMHHDDAHAAVNAASDSAADGGGYIVQHASMAPSAAGDQLHSVQLVQLSCTASASEGEGSAAAAAAAARMHPSGGSCSSSCSGSKVAAVRGVTFAADVGAVSQQQHQQQQPVQDPSWQQWQQQQQLGAASQCQLTSRAAAASSLAAATAAALAGRLVDAYGALVESDVLTPEQLAFVYQQQQPQLLRMVRPRGGTLPEGILSRAIQQVQTLKQQQHQGLQTSAEAVTLGSTVQLLGSSSSSSKGNGSSRLEDSTFADAAAAVISGSGSSASSRSSSRSCSLQHAEGYVKR
jgi:hypothetical protein